MDQDEIIGQFVVKYNSCQSCQFEIKSWPDKLPENRNRPACDAYAESPGVRSLAIEHTNVQSFKGQKEDAEHFRKRIGVLETELKHVFTDEILLSIPTFGLRHTEDLDAATRNLREWLMTYAESLPIGETYYEIRGVPCRITIRKTKGHGVGFGVMRWTPPGLDTHDELTELVAIALTKKNKKMERYRTNGDETVLILESDDIANMNHVIFYESFLLAKQTVQTPNIDQVWFADTIGSEKSCTFIGFIAPEAILDVANKKQWYLGPRYEAEWLERISRN